MSETPTQNNSVFAQDVKPQNSTVSGKTADLKAKNIDIGKIKNSLKQRAISLAEKAAIVKGNTLEAIQQRGFLLCGVSSGILGLSYIDEAGTWQGLDVEFCKALSAAIFGDKDKVQFVVLSSSERFTELRKGTIDVLSRNSTWTLSRDINGMDFVGVILYDGQGFMVRNDASIDSVKQLNNMPICYSKSSTGLLNLQDFFTLKNMNFKGVEIANTDDVIPTLSSRKCNVFSSDKTYLLGLKQEMPNPANWSILSDVISKEPLGPVIRHGDNAWGDIVRWTLNVIILAEEYGMESNNIRKFQKSKNGEILRLIGDDTRLGKQLGIRPDFAYQIISKVGNYKEIIERTLIPLGFKRGKNIVWTKGGLLYAPPFR